MRKDQALEGDNVDTANIIELKKIQDAGFNYDQTHVDVLVRSGFKPTDVVYSLIVEFNDSPTLKAMYLTIVDLKHLADLYPQKISSPEEMIGLPVKVFYYREHGTRYDSFIQKLEPNLLDETS